MSDERVQQLLGSAPLLYALARDALSARGVFPDHSDWLVPPASGLDLTGTRVAAALDDELGLLTPILSEAESWEWSPARESAELLLRHADRFESAVRMVAESLAAQWWWRPLDRSRQTWITPEPDAEPVPFDVDFADGLPDSTTPRNALWTSTRVGSLPGTALFFAWDAQVSPPVAVWDLPVEADAAVYEITNAADWVRLCSTYPRDTTERRADTWAEDLGVAGSRIVTPAWERVAADWDAVHLTVSGLLTTTCRSLPLDGAVTSLLRWHTETTAWFAPRFSSATRSSEWTGDLPFTG